MGCTTSGVSHTIPDVVPPFTYILTNELPYGPNQGKTIELVDNKGAASYLRELIAHNSWEIMCNLLCDDALLCTTALLHTPPTSSLEYQVDLLDPPIGCTVKGPGGETLQQDVPLSDSAICDQSQLVLGGCDYKGRQHAPQGQQGLMHTPAAARGAGNNQQQDLLPQRPIDPAWCTSIPQARKASDLETKVANLKNPTTLTGPAARTLRSDLFWGTKIQFPIDHGVGFYVGETDWLGKADGLGTYTIGTGVDVHTFVGHFKEGHIAMNSFGTLTDSNGRKVYGKLKDPNKDPAGFPRQAGYIGPLEDNFYDEGTAVLTLRPLQS